MNTLLLTALYVVVFLELSVDAVRKWPPSSRPRVLRSLWIASYGVLLVISAGAFLYLISHPSDIQPLATIIPEWLRWILYVFVALFFLVILIRLGEITRNLLHRLARQR